MIKMSVTVYVFDRTVINVLVTLRIFDRIVILVLVTEHALLFSGCAMVV